MDSKQELNSAMMATTTMQMAAVKNVLFKMDSHARKMKIKGVFVLQINHWE